jgi:hypothetical protein
LAEIAAAMRVYSYIVKDDGGFSPNPFHGACTLACCKPSIRRVAARGDIVVGLARKGERLVYAMQIERVLGFDEYWRAHPEKRPTWRSSHHVERVGDNIYEPIAIGEFRQLPSVHSEPDGTERPKDKVHDLGGEHVLLGRRFSYFGQTRPSLPRELAFLKIGRGHRCRFTPEQVAAVRRWFEGLPQGVHGRPSIWPATDDSWRRP